MDKRKLGQLEVSPIGMGCMGFSHGYGQVPPEAYAIEAIRGAYDYGCTHFDTAEAYGKEQFYAGHNEELVGKAIEPFRKKVVLATKFHIGELSKPDETNLYREVRRHLEDSMSRLRTDYIDLYYLHRISEAVRLEDVATVMGRLIQDQFGFDDVRKFVPQLSKENIEANQPILNLLHRFAVEKHATNAQISLAWMLHKYPNVVPIPGSKNQERILENLGAWNVTLYDDEFRQLQSALDECKVHGHRGCVETEQTSFGKQWSEETDK